MTAPYLAGGWGPVIEACHRLGIVAVDSETYGHDVTTSSPAHRAVVDVWSIALPTGELDPRGYERYRGAVLPAVALSHPGWVEVLESDDILKVLHNAGHDAHAFANHGVNMSNWVDTLDLLRLILPDRFKFDLKAAEVEVLGMPARPDYMGLVGTVERYEVRERLPCPLPQDEEHDPARCNRRTCGHQRPLVVTVKERPGKPLAIEAIGPDHERWAAKLDYSAADSVGAGQLYSYLMARAASMPAPVVPWSTFPGLPAAR